MTTPAVACLFALRARPNTAMAEDVCRVDVEMSIKAAIAEEGCTRVAAFAFPFGMVDSTKMA